ncbi:hypothetical protein, partial [Bacillus anthracis]
MRLHDSRIKTIPQRDLANNIWFIEENSWGFTIVEQHDGYFYAYYHNGFWNDDRLWFISYAAARR